MKGWNVLVYILLGVMLCTNVYQCRRLELKPPIGTYTDTIPFCDTIPFYKPVPKDSLVISYVTKVLSIVPKGDESVQEELDFVPNGDGFVPDSAEVVLPVTQKMYETDDYRAWVSGVEPALDSLMIFSKSQTIFVHDKPKSWRVSAIGSVGGSAFGVNANAGLELSYTKGRWTFAAQGGYMCDRIGAYPYGKAVVRFDLLKF